MNDVVRSVLGIALLVAAAGIALFVLFPTPDDAPDAAPVVQPADAPPVAPAPAASPIPAAGPPPGSDPSPRSTTDPGALLADLEVLELDPEAAVEDEAAAFRSLMAGKMERYGALETALAAAIDADEPEALLLWARAQVAMGDVFAQTVLPEGLTEKQTAVYVEAAEKRARSLYDDALALLDRAEAADPSVAPQALALREQIQAR